MQKLVVLTGILFSLIACQKSEKSASSDASRSLAGQASLKIRAARTATNDRQLRAVLNKSSISCEGECPEAVGHLIGWEPAGESYIEKGSCTAFLVADDIVATDSHCIPQTVVDDPSLCAERLGVKFPALGRLPEETLTCTEFIYASDFPYRNLPLKTKLPSIIDYAFFHVQSSGRKPFTISRSGVKDQTPLQIYVARIVSDAPDKTTTLNLNTVIRKQVCISHEHTIVANYSHDYSPFVLAFGDDCVIQHGDSGAPEINEAGEVPAIVNSIDDEVTGYVEGFAKKFKASWAPSARWPLDVFSVNFACLDLPPVIGVVPKPNECSHLKELNDLADKNLGQAQNLSRHDNEVKERDEWREQQPSIFKIRPDIVTENPMTSMTTALLCLIPKEIWPQLPRVPNVENNKVTVKFFDQTSQYQLMVDANLVGKSVETAREKRPIEINIDLSLVGSADIVVGTQTTKGVKASFSTHWCSPQELKN